MMEVNIDFIFTATKYGIIEVWLRERVSRVASIKMGSSRELAKITSLVSDIDGGMLYAGSSDGKIQVRTQQHKITPQLKKTLGIKYMFSWYSFHYVF